MSKYVFPILLILLLVFCLIKRINIYSTFISGAKKSLELVYDIFAYIVAIFIVIELLNESGLTETLTQLLSPIFNFLGIPIELSKFVIVKPFSGSGSLALLSEVYTNFGVDSYIGKCASIILGSSETVFFVSSIYFSQTSIKKFGRIVQISLFCYIISVVLSCLFARFI